ncbi:hypothetical protein Q5424_27295 [Conexibacter sp. JD483]|uniref:hypothetical protein n=1 Tax=unclassified Conexibacter TaxID=2627773 RepID=UPI0027259A79|nr:MULTISPECIES: hypothetical protein [unclassified Conexibacter]MDO8189540.1 hypothetical protein [Conexibacter sp. CPCC 205706]MDO8202105.1 hypothetical protein [Conexibacter sp. CPCC 205762]MDR9372836.1 hypothetical protein [Conexibacter sp. JD483]
MSGRRERLLALATALLLIGGIAAIALAQDGGGTPSIALDAEGPLFELQGMQPGAPPTERCIALSARGGTATRLDVSATVSGSLGQRLRMRVEGGDSPGPGPGTSRSCNGFTPAQTLWEGTLADFPQAGAPAVSDGSLADGASRAFRFRVWLPSDAVVTPNETATQTITWRASLDAPTTPTPAPEPTPTPTPAETTPAPTPTPTPERQSLDQPSRACGGAIRCRGRLIARLTPHAARLHLRVHAPGAARIRALTLVLPASLPAARTRIEVTHSRVRGTILQLDGRLRVRDRAHRRLLTLNRLPVQTRTVLMHVRVPPSARRALVRAACRRATVTARLSTVSGRRTLKHRLYIAPARCRAR